MAVSARDELRAAAEGAEALINACASAGGFPGGDNDECEAGDEPLCGRWLCEECGCVVDIRASLRSALAAGVCRMKPAPPIPGLRMSEINSPEPFGTATAADRNGAGSGFRERGILFSAPMVRAILSGAKTQTRRVIAPQPVFYETLPPELPLCAARHERPGWWWHGKRWGIHSMPTEAALLENFNRRPWSPFGKPGDRLWVRETFCVVDDREFGGDRWVDYRATPKYTAEHPAGWENAPHDPAALKWRPCIFMPRWASRITLEITDVRVERIQDITEADARAEGVEPFIAVAIAHPLKPRKTLTTGSVRVPYVHAYSDLWDSLNAPRGYGWDANPWVWALTFRVLETAVPRLAAVQPSHGGFPR